MTGPKVACILQQGTREAGHFLTPRTELLTVGVQTFRGDTGAISPRGANTAVARYLA